MKNWGTVVAGLLLLYNTVGIAQAETKDPKVPLIVSDKCSATPDENGARRCEVVYSDGSSDVYWVKNGWIFWHYPVAGMPSGGRYRPQK